MARDKAQKLLAQESPPVLTSDQETAIDEVVAEAQSDYGFI